MAINSTDRPKQVNLALQLNGATVATLKGVDLSAGNHFLTWDGLTTNGQAAAHGNYKIVIQAKAAEGDSVAAILLSGLK